MVESATMKADGGTMVEQDWVVRDDSRELRFTGVKLAEISSRQPHKKRWIELSLYRTRGGNYVVERIGRTLYERNPSTGVPERDYYFGQVCDTPRAVIETLYARDGEGAWFLSWVARDVLETAAKLDEQIEEAYRTEHVD